MCSMMKLKRIQGPTINISLLMNLLSISGLFETCSQEIFSINENKTAENQYFHFSIVERYISIRKAIHSMMMIVYQIKSKCGSNDTWSQYIGLLEPLVVGDGFPV